MMSTGTFVSVACADVAAQASATSPEPVLEAVVRSGPPPEPVMPPAPLVLLGFRNPPAPPESVTGALELLAEDALHALKERAVAEDSVATTKRELAKD